MLSRMQNILALLAVLSLTSGTASAQSTAATVSGTIIDASGASVPDAKIIITNLATRESRTIQTNSSGLFVAPDINDGIYDVSVEKAGFRRLTKTGVVVNPQDRLSLGEMVLQVGAPTDTVT